MTGLYAIYTGKLLVHTMKSTLFFISDAWLIKVPTCVNLIRTYANLAHGDRFLIFNPLNPPYQGDL